VPVQAGFTKNFELLDAGAQVQESGASRPQARYSKKSSCQRAPAEAMRTFPDTFT
jgi:hypothetical protein